jgi:hypothetical protein
MTGGWSEFFIAMVGAGAALAGLIVVTMSVTIKQILEYPGLTPRAAVTLSALVAVVVIAAITLVPFHSSFWLGLVLTIASALSLLPVFNLTRQLVKIKPIGPLPYLVYKLATGWIQALPAVVGSILVLAGQQAGLGWIAAGMLCAIVYSMLNAWVLLVEIQR